MLGCVDSEISDADFERVTKRITTVGQTKGFLRFDNGLAR
jgi:hypothetical protein